MEEMRGARAGAGVRGFHALSQPISLPAPYTFTNPEALWTQSFGDFVKASSPRHD